MLLNRNPNCLDTEKFSTYGNEMQTVQAAGNRFLSMQEY